MRYDDDTRSIGSTVRQTITQFVKLHGHVGMKAEIATADNSGIAVSFSDGSVSLLQGIQTGATGGVDRVTRTGNTQIIRDAIGQHGARTTADAETVCLLAVTKWMCVMFRSLDDYYYYFLFSTVNFS